MYQESSHLGGRAQTRSKAKEGFLEEGSEEQGKLMIVIYRLPGHWSVHPPSLPASFHPKLSPAWTQMPSKAPHPSSPQPPC